MLTLHAASHNITWTMYFLPQLSKLIGSTKKMSEPKENSNNIHLPATTDDDSSAAAKEKSSKRQKTSSSTLPTVLTFSTAHDRFARLQLLSSHTLYNLISALCRHTPVGYEGSEGPDDHLWYVTTEDGTKYESSEFECESELRANRTKLDSLGLAAGDTLRLNYDYGTTSHYTLKLLEQRPLMMAEEDPDVFPRNNVDSGMPPAYSKYAPTAINGDEVLNLDTTFAHLQRWMFHSSEAGPVNVNLFQAGKKKNYGFMNNDCRGVLGMMYLPVKADDLANYLMYFNEGAKVKPKGVETDGYPHYNWHSVVIVPTSKRTNALDKKYCDRTQRGFCDAVVCGDMDQSNNLNAYFPKIAALAGYRKDRQVPKGWITLTKRGNTFNMVICSGNCETKKSNAPKGTAYDGRDQHTPVEEPLIQVSSVEITGLNDLFCVVEGLLMTL
mmetsp:Transcript_385/g.636  ORF Transcript_385/g.636 Transcript_385/m.636 type:complete len:440 (+) Transcript_385:17-1336(+)